MSSNKKPREHLRNDRILAGPAAQESLRKQLTAQHLAPYGKLANVGNRRISPATMLYWEVTAGRLSCRFVD